MLKYYYKSFDKITETEYIINSIIKELKNIQFFLEKSQDIVAKELSEKIQKEINNYENKRKPKKYNGRKYYSPSKSSNEKISLTNKEKDILTNFFFI